MNKTKYVPVRMGEQMKRDLEDARLELGVRSRSEVVRLAVQDYLSSNRPMIRQELVQEFEKVRRDFSNVGNNINQVAYRLNAGHPIATKDVVETQESLQRTFAEMVRFYRSIEGRLRG